MTNTTTHRASGFRWSDSLAGRAMVCTPLGRLASHLFTTRALTFREGTMDEDARRLAHALSVSRDELVTVRQVHGREVLIVTPGAVIPALVEADAIVSTDAARAIAVRVADCVPILLADRQRRLVAAVHAGWRGTAAGITTATVETIRGLGVAPADLVAAIGPSIGPCCYQVDGKVRVAFGTAPEEEASFIPDGVDRWKLDLWRANARQLETAGVASEAVHVLGMCTADHLGTCFSFRAEGPLTGRMVAAIRRAF